MTSDSLQTKYDKQQIVIAWAAKKLKILADMMEDRGNRGNEYMFFSNESREISEAMDDILRRE